MGAGSKRSNPLRTRGTGRILCRKFLMLLNQLFIKIMCCLAYIGCQQYVLAVNADFSSFSVLLFIHVTIKYLRIAKTWLCRIRKTNFYLFVLRRARQHNEVRGYKMATTGTGMARANYKISRKGYTLALHVYRQELTLPLGTLEMFSQMFLRSFVWQ